MKVFLGGARNGSRWRERLIPDLKRAGMDFFNPAVEDWTPECQAEEIRQRATCDAVLYVLTPMGLNIYSVAEVIDDSNKRPDRTVFCYLPGECDRDGNVHEFTPAQQKTLNAVGEMVRKNGGTWCAPFAILRTLSAIRSKLL